MKLKGTVTVGRFTKEDARIACRKAGRELDLANSTGWVAVRAMVLRKDTNRLMDELWSVGARGILVTDIHACRL